MTARSTVASSADPSDDIASVVETVTVVVNGRPTDILLENPVLEEASPGNIVGPLSAVDPDAGDTFEYAIAGGADADKFDIDDNNNLKLKEGVSLDYDDPAERQQEVRIRVTDQDGLSTEKLFTLDVTPRDEKTDLRAGHGA